MYSVNENRSKELVKLAKRYISYARSNEKVKEALRKYNVVVPHYIQNNETAYSLVSCVDPDVINVVTAKPKGADSCRGDNGHANFFDEMGFITADFWYQFALPLIQVENRVFTMATTPAHRGSFFASLTDDFIAANQEGNHLFHVINHSRTCEECFKEGVNDCGHCLGTCDSPFYQILFVCEFCIY